MNQTNQRWGTMASIQFLDWSHSYINETTGSMTPMMLGVKGYGTYSFEIIDSELFKNVEHQEEKDDIAHLISSKFSIYISNLSYEKKPVLDLAYYIKKDDLLEQINEEAAKQGFKVTDITIETIKLDEVSEEKINRYVMENNQNLVVNNNITNQENNTQSTTYKSSEDQIISEPKSNTFIIIGVVLAVIIIVSIVSVILIKSKK